MRLVILLLMLPGLVISPLAVGHHDHDHAGKQTPHIHVGFHDHHEADECGFEDHDYDSPSDQFHASVHSGPDHDQCAVYVSTVDMATAADSQLLNFLDWPLISVFLGHSTLSLLHEGFAPRDQGHSLTSRPLGLRALYVVHLTLLV